MSSSSGWVLNASPEVNARSQYPVIIGVCVGLSAVMLIVTCLRTYVRLRMVRAFGADDAVLIFSAVCSIIYSALCITQSRLGLGLPLALRPPADIDQYTVVNFAGRPFYMAGITGFKVALCIAYLRISSHSSMRRYRQWIWAIGIFAVASHLAGTLALIFQCQPVQKSWLPRTPGSCLPNDTFFYALAAITIFCDVVIFVTPIPLLLRLRINLRRKLGLVALFMLGLFTTACSVMRMVQIIQIAKDGNSTGLILWGTIEMNVGIILTSLPTLAPLISFFRSDSASGYRYRYGGPGGAGGAGGGGGPGSKRHSRHMLGHGAPRLSGSRTVGGATTIGTARMHPRSGLVPDDPDASSQETILPIQGPGAAAPKAVEEGYILRSVDISVTRGGPGPAEGLRAPGPMPPASPATPHAL